MMMRTMALAGAGLAASAGAAGAQVYPYGAGTDAGFAAERCTAAVQYRLDRKTGVRGYGGQHIGGQVVAVTKVDPGNRIIRVHGLAVSDRHAYGPYGVGAYGTLGGAYGQADDMTFRCSVDYGGRVTEIDINRR
jgi:hypothetical protein